jgi:ArsR family transcriptional regulator
MEADAGISKVALIIKSIAHPIRLKILCILLEGEQSVGEIHSHFSSTYANTSQHLQKLGNMGLLRGEKRANFIYYSIQDHRIQEVVRLLKKLYCHESQDSTKRKKK